MGKNERRGWTLVAIFLLIGLLCVFMAGNLAIRFAPRWTLQADMRSRLNPDGAYYTPQPGYSLPPLDPAILTPPIWINFFLTPGASIPTRVPNATATLPNTSAPTLIPSTDAPTITPTSTGAFISFTPTKLSIPNLTATKTATVASIGSLTPSRTSTAIPTATRTATATATGTLTRTSTPTATSTAISTPTWTATSTATATATYTATSAPTATPTNTPVYTDPTPGEIGPSPDGIVYNLPAGGSLTLDFPIDVNGHAGPDLVYYELPMGSGIWLDWVIVEIGDGSNWYTVFNWGDNIADSNSNMDFTKLSPPVMGPTTPDEPDQRDILSTELYPYPGTGIAIDLDNVAPPGSYSYLRFTCPTSVGGVDDTDGKMEIDAIERLN